MESEDLTPHINEDIIGSATSVDEIISALAKRGCMDLTSSINLTACSDFPCAGGGFCDVYQGALHNGTRIAIKSLRVYDGPKSDSERKKILKHAARELYHWSKLRHHNVVPLLGLMLFRGCISMISEWMGNGNLTSFLKNKPDANRTRLCMDVCGGLCYIHAQGMVHGDLKASNVLVSSRGVAMIADFGNARLKDLTLKFSNTTGHSISLRWTAPELLVQDSGQASKESDVYAYGMTVLEVITGKVPFDGVDERRVFGLVAYERKHPSRPSADMDDKIWQLMEQCWAESPAKRPSMKNVGEYLQAIYPECEMLPPESKHGEVVLAPSDVPEEVPVATSARPIVGSNPDKAIQFTNLGMSYISRYDRVRYFEDVNKAIDCLIQAVLLTPDDYAGKPSRLDSLGISYTRRFEGIGELSDLEKAIEYQTQAVLITPGDHPSKPGFSNNLGISHQYRFQRIGELEDVDKSIRFLTQAVMLSAGDDPDKPIRLDNLGNSYRHRFHRLGELDDNKKAVECQAQAVLLTPDDHPDKPGLLYNLGTAYQSHFQHTGKVDDIDKAIECQTQSVMLTPESHKDKLARLNSLGSLYQLRFDRFGKVEDVNKAIEYQIQAMRLTPEQ